MPRPKARDYTYPEWCPEFRFSKSQRSELAVILTQSEKSRSALPVDGDKEEVVIFFRKETQLDPDEIKKEIVIVNGKTREVDISRGFRIVPFAVRRKVDILDQLEAVCREFLRINSVAEPTLFCL